MKKTLFICAAAAMTLAACSKTGTEVCTDQETGIKEMAPVTVRLNGPVTKSAGETEETRINSLQVAVYLVNDGKKEFESYYSFDPQSMEGTIYIDKSKTAEKYLIAAYANQESMTQAGILEDWSLFSEEKAGDFQMYGEWCDLKENLGTTIPIQLNRQCSKVTVRKVSLKWTNSANNHKTFKLKSMYLMDTEGVYANVNALTSAIQTENPWLNKNGHNSTEYDEFLYRSTDDITLTEAVPYESEQVFYGYVSDLDKWNSTSSWAPSGTRLVLEADFDGRICYYAIPLRKEGVSTPYRNKHFVFENIVITKPGSDMPYSDLTEETGVAVTLSVNPWDTIDHGEVTIR